MKNAVDDKTFYENQGSNDPNVLKLDSINIITFTNRKMKTLQ
jgi:hypothetical protein